MPKPRLTRSRVVIALGVAVAADCLQWPLTAAFATGALSPPSEAANFALDCLVMLLTARLLGFHWVLLPSLLVEFVPGVDLFPTWSGCVAYLVWHRLREQKSTAFADTAVAGEIHPQLREPAAIPPRQEPNQRQGGNP